MAPGQHQIGGHVEFVSQWTAPGQLRVGIGHMVRQALPAAKIRRSAQFLINRKGEVVARFAPDVTADDPRLVAAIDAELAAGS